MGDVLYFGIGLLLARYLFWPFFVTIFTPRRAFAKKLGHVISEEERQEDLQDTMVVGTLVTALATLIWPVSLMVTGLYRFVTYKRPLR